MEVIKVGDIFINPANIETINTNIDIDGELGFQIDLVSGKNIKLSFGYMLSVFNALGIDLDRFRF